MSNKNTTLPSILSFDRKLEPSDALMYSANWQDVPEANSTDSDKPKSDTEKELVWKKVLIKPRFNRSTQSAYGIKEEKKSDANPVSSGNDDANLFSSDDTLKVSFTMRVIGNVGEPFACNLPSFETAIKSKVKDFKETTAFSTLAFRYAYNIANGRFLWRNRVCAEDIIIHVAMSKKDEKLTFKAYDFSLKNFEKNKDDSNLKKLANHIYEGLKSEDHFTSIEVNAYVNLGKGQHVYPSEEMNMKEDGKTLFKLEDCGAMHSVKIGNAIRTIDNWHGGTLEDKNDNRPIAIEPYGAVTQRGVAYRPSKNDLYTFMKRWFEKKEEKSSDNLEDEQKIYVVANLIRGGLFQMKS